MAKHMQHSDLEHGAETFSKRNTKPTIRLLSVSCNMKIEIGIFNACYEYYLTHLRDPHSLQSHFLCVRRRYSPLCEKQVQFKRTYLMKICFSLLANCKFISCLLCRFTLFQLYAHTKLKILRSSPETCSTVQAINEIEREREKAAN